MRDCKKMDYRIHEKAEQKVSSAGRDLTCTAENGFKLANKQAKPRLSTAFASCHSTKPLIFSFNYFFFPPLLSFISATPPHLGRL